MQLHLILLQELGNLCYITYHLSEYGEIKVCSDTTLLHSAFFKTTAGRWAASVPRRMGFFLAVLIVLMC